MANDAPGGKTSQGSPQPSRQKTGPGNPPIEYRWPKGCRSPNPFGRPKKSHLKDLFGHVDPLSAQVLEHDKRVIGIVDGEEITNGDAFLRALSRRATKENAAARLYDQIRRAAYQTEQEHRLAMSQAAIDHKLRYSAMFALHAALGKPPPKIFPHPDDIIIDKDFNVRVVGPGDEEGQRHLETILKYQDLLIEIGALHASPIGRACDDETARKLWLQTRRKFYRVNPVVPPRLRRRFPRFEPSVE